MWTFRVVGLIKFPLYIKLIKKQIIGPIKSNTYLLMCYFHVKIKL